MLLEHRRTFKPQGSTFPHPLIFQNTEVLQAAGPPWTAVDGPGCRALSGGRNCSTRHDGTGNAPVPSSYTLRIRPISAPAVSSMAQKQPRACSASSRISHSSIAFVLPEIANVGASSSSDEITMDRYPS